IILKKVEDVLKKKKILKNKYIVVTAGPTREYIDKIRFITNKSSGRMGYALAEELAFLGAEVVLISGPVNLSRPYGVELIKTETSEEMLKACLKSAKSADILIMAAAVSDFKPLKKENKKIKKNKALKIEFGFTKDILKELQKKKKKNQIIVGFAAESGEILKNARKKMEEKGLDMIVANNIDEGFGTETNKVTIIDKKLKIETTARVNKREIARKVIERILKLMN
ncbi:MAG: bifunctional phosphopantothenoylcysteine decarboxylase/phosphopantothenate--cysteine ligase CoaBC, partial [Actinomycetia bacterium]|nr:bifunctional phosphopantothenoylcysteine decarboxylase/phosphopantothenate--cysteine ligase CoaBC [Actinomycetes bacterium]